MFIRRLQDCTEFVAGDGSILRELLHPDKAALSLRYSLAHAVVRPGRTTLPHRLATSEVYFILAGEGIMHIDDETARLLPGDAVYIPPGAMQRIRNPSERDLLFICIVDPAWRKEDEQVFGEKNNP